MLKKEYDKLKKQKKQAAAIAQACEGADDVTAQVAFEPKSAVTTQIRPADKSMQLAVWSTAIVVFLLVLVI